MNLANGTWRVIAASPLSGRDDPNAVWTGTEMIVWGGFVGDDIRTYDGAAYNPNTDTWRMLPTVPFSMGGGVTIMTMVWTGDEAVVNGARPRPSPTTRSPTAGVVSTGRRRQETRSGPATRSSGFPTR